MRSTSKSVNRTHICRIITLGVAFIQIAFIDEVLLMFLEI